MLTYFNTSKSSHLALLVRSYKQALNINHRFIFLQNLQNLEFIHEKFFDSVNQPYKVYITKYKNLVVLVCMKVMHKHSSACQNMNMQCLVNQYLTTKVQCVCLARRSSQIVISGCVSGVSRL